MAEEMMLENVPWESEDAEDSEAEEALVEAEDSEDIGERWPFRRRRRRRRYYRPARGVRGIVLRGHDGRARSVPFPAKLATTEETNRGLASQEVARRALEERLDKLETRFRVQQKRDSSASGLVSLVVGVPLTAWGAINGKQTGTSRLGSWAEEQSTKMAALASATQLATSGAKFLVNGQYHRSGVGIAADIFSVAQLAAFAFASMYKPEEYEFAGTEKEAKAKAKDGKFKRGQRILTQDAADQPVIMWRVLADASGKQYLLKMQDN